MKFSVDKSALLPLLTLAQSAVERKTTAAQLNHVYLDCQSDYLRIYATDLELQFIAQLAVQTQQAGQSVLPAQKLFEIVRELADGPISFHSAPSYQVEVLQGRFRGRIKGLPPAEYPLFAIQAPPAWVTVSTSDLLDWIQHTEFAVSQDMTRAYLAGIYMESQDSNRINIVATDGFRLALYQAQVSFDPKMFDSGVIVPKKGISELKKILTELELQSVDISTDRVQFYVKSDSVQLAIRLIEGRFPKYQSVIPNNPYHLSVSKMDFLKTLKRVSLLSQLKSKAVTLVCQEDRLIIKAASSDYGDAQDEIPAQYRGQPLEIIFNPTYLEDAISAISEDILEITLESSERPAVVRGLENDSYLNVIMPMKL